MEEGRINWLAQLESGISASVDRGGNGSGFEVGSIWLVILENHRSICVQLGDCLL